MKYSNFYTTKNPEHAALLLSMLQPLESSYCKEGEYYFVFQNAVKCEKVVKDFQRNRLIVDAKSLFEAIKTINNMISQV